MKRLTLALCGLMLGGLLTGNMRADDSTPIAHFFAEPDYSSVQLAPDGQHLAFLSTLANGRVGVALMSLASGKIEPLVAAGDENIDFFFWKGPDRIVYGGDFGGNESVALRSISLSPRKVVPLAESYRERYADRANQAAILDTLRFDPEHILVLGNKSIGSFTFGLWKLNVRTGKRTLVENLEGGNEDVSTRECDNLGRVLARSVYVGDKIVFEVRSDPAERFARVAEFPANDSRWTLLGFAADNETLYLLSNEHTDTGQLHSLNVRTRQLSAPIFHVPDGEISDIVLSYDKTKLLGVAFTTDRERWHWFDPARARLQAQIDASLPGTHNQIVSRTADEKVFVIAASSDRDPGTYYILDLRTPRLMKLGRINRHLDPTKMRPMEPIAFTARDGLTLHGYLTRPAGYENRPAPLIINPHGGPFGIRDVWGFNPEVQFLASRGYAVLQINYRGSGGYGRTFLEAGKREWGGKMQDDLTDGVRWAIAQGIADPERVAIYGASYGGYAALAGVTFTPELYRCAANYVGVADLGLITSWSRRFGDRNAEIFYREWVGDSKEYLQSRSPVNFVERIRVPTLHAYGFNDPRVDIKHWQRLEPKLKQFNKPYEAWVEDREGHGFSNERSRINFYERLEAFFARHLAAPAPAATPAGKSG
jgi:dipeptidyl aminopeptidase/acylaminoacyl peptidase